MNGTPSDGRHTLPLLSSYAYIYTETRSQLMRERLRFFFYYAIFWMVFMVVIRATFLVYNIDLSGKLSAGDVFRIFWNGARMDLSMTGYFVAFVGLVLTASVFFAGRWVSVLISSVTVALLVFSVVVTIVDVELYRHWGFRLNTTPLFYAGSEAMGSIETSMVLKTVPILIVLLAGSLYFYFRRLSPLIRWLSPAKPAVALAMFGLSALMFLPIRGSFTVAPMNTGFVYFHKSNPFANHAAINVIWNFINSVRKGSRIVYPEDFFNKALSKTYVDSLYRPSDSTASLLNTSRPNIILFIVESFTADVIGPLGGRSDISPALNALCREGILFDNFYSSGDRTDKGLISVLSGYPAQPTTSIIKFPDKTRHLPYLNQSLRDLGYHTSFTYGGDIDFANFRSYLTSCAFDHITTEEDFDDDINISKWGVHDHYMLDRAFNECDTASAPFFKTILTLSSHEPFDVPHTNFIKGLDEESRFLNACHYTDSSLGVFISKAKATSWWKNTLVILVADHGHRHPGNKQIKDKERFRIPLLMIGGAVKKDTVIHTFGGHTDIPHTLLSQLGQSPKDFIFSKDLADNRAASFAFYFFNDGYGMVAPDKYIIYDNTGKQFLRKDNASEKDLDVSKAYEQFLFSDYNKR